MTFPLNEMYGYSRLCDSLRSSAIIWKQVSLRSSAIRDRLRSFAIIWKPAFRLITFPFSVFLSVSIRSPMQFDMEDYNTVGGGKSSHPLTYDKSLRINGGEAAIVG